MTVAATEASKGMSVWSILAFPALFSAGMSLIDTTDGILMLGAYGWAFVKPIRKLYYNLTNPVVSAIVALFIGGIEALGYGIIGIFAVSWIVSTIVYRVRRLDEVQVSTPDRT